jgi:hypothetical protein
MYLSKAQKEARGRILTNAAGWTPEKETMENLILTMELHKEEHTCIFKIGRDGALISAKTEPDFIPVTRIPE